MAGLFHHSAPLNRACERLLAALESVAARLGGPGTVRGARAGAGDDEKNASDARRRVGCAKSRTLGMGAAPLEWHN